MARVVLIGEDEARLSRQLVKRPGGSRLCCAGFHSRTPDFVGRARRRSCTAHLSTQLATARLDALRLQLHPHFLFNAMNTVAMLIRQGAADDAVRSLTSLSEILRHLIAAPDVQEVLLWDELGLLDRCLDIERLRFGDRLRVVRDIDPETLDALVPNLILQPVVENALRHGIASRDAGTVFIVAHRQADQLCLEVRDDGPGLQDGTDFGTGTGVGIRNTVERLSSLYGEDFDLHLEDRSAEGQRGTRAAITLPFHTSPWPVDPGYVGPV